ncbi:hypothetical protein [Pseudosulfitobacter pseudonitzschiae]|uniref:hypothetical protein n=1 Tax=Pseudosulfitobacter pseudonitzschiae TaxID=1402135 RepID=UPI003B7D122D
MRSVNILITQDIAKKIDAESRSAAVRDIASTIIEAYEQGAEWVISEIHRRVVDSSPKKRREDEKNGVIWEKAIVWIPEAMKREIERLSVPNNLRVSEFLRGAVIYATDDKKP